MISEADWRGPAFLAIGLLPGLAWFPGLARGLGLLRLSVPFAILPVGACGWHALVALAARRTCVQRASFCNSRLLRLIRSW